MRQVHPVARTNRRTRAEMRAEMRASEDFSAALAKRYKVSIATARHRSQLESPRKPRKGRDHAQDRSPRPHTLATTLSAGCPRWFANRLPSSI